MPIYEYQCKQCGHQDSFLESMRAPKTRKCPQCKKPRAFTRLVSAAGFQLKGQGWYQTDFKNPKPAAANKSDKPDDKKKSDDSKSKKDGDSGDGKTDKKAERKQADKNP